MVNPVGAMGCDEGREGDEGEGGKLHGVKE